MQTIAVTGSTESAIQDHQGTIGHVLWLAGIILIAGALGGLINYFQHLENIFEQPKVTKTSRSMHGMLRRIVIGIGAAFLVPLFLNMISSDLLTVCEKTPTKLLVFAGFCLVAAISSSAFIRSMSSQLLEQVAKKAEDASQSVDEIRSDLEPIKAKATEPKVEGAPSDRKDPPGNRVASLTQDQKKVMGALYGADFAFRSVEGISKATGLESTDLSAILAGLEKEGLVRKTTTDQGVRWCITKEGRVVDASTENAPRPSSPRSSS